MVGIEKSLNVSGSKPHCPFWRSLLFCFQPDAKYFSVRSYRLPLEPFIPGRCILFNSTYFWVESKGIPTTHPLMMAGISSNRLEDRYRYRNAIPGAECLAVSNPPSLIRFRGIPYDFTRSDSYSYQITGFRFSISTNTAWMPLLPAGLDCMRQWRADRLSYHILLHLYAYNWQSSLQWPMVLRRLSHLQHRARQHRWKRLMRISGYRMGVLSLSRELQQRIQGTIGATQVSDRRYPSIDSAGCNIRCVLTESTAYTDHRLQSNGMSRDIPWFIISYQNVLHPWYSWIP